MSSRLSWLGLRFKIHNRFVTACFVCLNLENMGRQAVKYDSAALWEVQDPLFWGMFRLYLTILSSLIKLQKIILTFYRYYPCNELIHHFKPMFPLYVPAAKRLRVESFCFIYIFSINFLINLGVYLAAVKMADSLGLGPY